MSVEALRLEQVQAQVEVLQSLLEVGVNLSVVTDRRQMLDMILEHARKLSQAEAGSLYILQNGKLRFAAAQNDKLPLPQVVQGLLEKSVPASASSLAGYVAATGRTMNIPDAYAVASGSPFSINHEFDAATGYRTVSILAIPLRCPNGLCVGVLELINRVGHGGRVVPFFESENEGVLYLASMAAVTIQNWLLQQQLKQAHLDSIIRLSVAAEFRDQATADHVQRMSHTSALVARAMGLDNRMVELIQCAAPMHDIGKIGVPDAILRKPGNLTQDERKVIEKHTVIGAQILGNPQNELLSMARDIALTHHEKWDGTGYPNGLAGDQLPLGGRIVGLTDVFDALMSRRCYKDAYSLEASLKIIKENEGKQFDPKVCKAFHQALDTILETYEPQTAGAAS